MSRLMLPLSLLIVTAVSLPDRAQAEAQRRSWPAFVTQPRTVSAAQPPASPVIPTPGATTAAEGPGRLNVLQRISVRRQVADGYADGQNIRFREAVEIVDKVSTSATPEQLAAASGATAASFKNGLYSEQAVVALCAKAGVKFEFKTGGLVGFAGNQVAKIGDGAIIKWLFSDEGQAAMIKFVQTVIKIITMLAPLFIVEKDVWDYATMIVERAPPLWTVIKQTRFYYRA